MSKHEETLGPSGGPPRPAPHKKPIANVTELSSGSWRTGCVILFVLIIAVALLPVFFYFGVSQGEKEINRSGLGASELIVDHMNENITRMYDPSTNVVFYLFPGDKGFDKKCILIKGD